MPSFIPLPPSLAIFLPWWLPKSRIVFFACIFFLVLSVSQLFYHRSFYLPVFPPIFSHCQSCSAVSFHDLLKGRWRPIVFFFFFYFLLSPLQSPHSAYFFILPLLQSSYYIALCISPPFFLPHLFHSYSLPPSPSCFYSPSSLTSSSPYNFHRAGGRAKAKRGGKIYPRVS